jgi:hypothetical protein
VLSSDFFVNIVNTFVSKLLLKCLFISELLGLRWVSGNVAQSAYLEQEEFLSLVVIITGHTFVPGENKKIPRIILSLLASVALWDLASGGYIPPGPLYRCPKESLLLHPCTCDIESDQGIYVSCNNTNLASMSVALNNLATFRIPIERLTIYRGNIGKFSAKIRSIVTG